MVEHERAFRPLQPAGPWLGRLAWLPVPLVALAGAVLYELHIDTVYESVVLLVTLSTLLNTATSLLMAYLAARTYRVTGSPAVLALGGGALAFGVATLWAGLLSGDLDAALTVYNGGLFLSGACFVRGAVCALRARRPACLPSQLPVSGLFYLGLAAILALIYWGHLARMVPAFYHAEQGFTSLRQAVLSLTALEFASASLCFFILYRRSRTPFVMWCSLGLALIGLGVLTIIAESAPGTPVSWVGRAGQYLGGVYMLVGIITVAEGPWAWQIPLEQALRESEAQLAAELADTRLLQSTSVALMQHDRVESLYERIMDAAIAIMRSDCASLQMLHPERGSGGELHLLAFRGFHPRTARLWEWVRQDTRTSCGVALRTGERVIVPDVEACEFMAGSQDLAMCRQDGIRAMQTTPLRSRTGKLLGMISTHWRRSHQPTERDLRLLDILARQAADLIERARAEAERERLLESERRAREQAEAALRLRDEFLSVAAHELKTPLTSLRAYPQLLLRRYDKGAIVLDQPLRRSLQVMEREATRLADLVTQLLDISRLDRGALTLDLQPTDLAGLAREAVESLQLLAPDHPLRLDAPPSLAGLVDPLRLRQVLVNLVDNAVQFSPQGSTVEIELTSPAPGTARFAVRDHGPGILPEERERLFSRYHRAGARRPAGGLGLGLYISRQIVEAHGGRIEAEFPADGGTRFVVALPAEANGD